MSLAPNYYLLDNSTESLIDFFASATSVNNEDTYKAQQECVIARYALRDKITIYTTLKDFIQEEAEANPREALRMLGKLDVAADKLIGTVERVVSLLKKATEIDILSSTRFDGVQLFHIVQQIPVIIGEMLNVVLVEQAFILIEGVLDISDAKLIKDLKTHIPVWAATVSKEVCNKLSSELEGRLKIVSVKEQSSENGSAVTEDQVRAMVNSVPSS